MCIVQYNQALPEMLCMRSLLRPLSPIIHSAFMYVYSTDMFLVPLDPLYKIRCQHLIDLFKRWGRSEKICYIVFPNPIS